MIRIENCELMHDEALMRLCTSFGEVVHFQRESSSSTTTTTGGASTAATKDIVVVGYEDAEDVHAAAGNINGMEFYGSYLRATVAGYGNVANSDGGKRSHRQGRGGGERRGYDRHS